MLPLPQVYAGPLAGGQRGVILANFQTRSSQYPRSNITVFWPQIGLQPGVRCRVRDLYAGARASRVAGCMAAAWLLHGCCMAA